MLQPRQVLRQNQTSLLQCLPDALRLGRFSSCEFTEQCKRIEPCRAPTVARHHKMAELDPKRRIYVSTTGSNLGLRLQTLTSDINHPI